MVSTAVGVTIGVTVAFFIGIITIIILIFWIKRRNHQHEGIG